MKNSSTKLDLLLLVAAGLLAGCSTAKVTRETHQTVSPMARPTTVYVCDFELEAQNIKQVKGILPPPPPLPLPEIGGPLGKLLPSKTDPEKRARQLVDLMAKSIVEQLNKSGFTATRLTAGAVTPANGWMIRGVFTEVQEGNRLQRAMIGFGKGATDVQVVTTADNLAQGKPQPLYGIETDANSGKGPGAAPTLVLGPYGAAARLVMAGEDLERNVKDTAGKIAQSVAKQVQAPAVGAQAMR